MVETSRFVLSAQGKLTSCLHKSSFIDTTLKLFVSPSCQRQFKRMFIDYVMMNILLIMTCVVSYSCDNASRLKLYKEDVTCSTHIDDHLLTTVTL